MEKEPIVERRKPFPGPRRSDSSPEEPGGAMFYRERLTQYLSELRFAFPENRL